MKITFKTKKVQEAYNTNTVGRLKVMVNELADELERRFKGEGSVLIVKASKNIVVLSKGALNSQIIEWLGVQPLNKENGYLWRYLGLPLQFDGKHPEITKANDSSRFNIELRMATVSRRR